MKTRLNVSVRGLFATPVAAMEVPDAEARNSELRAIILNKREQTPPSRRRTPADGIPTGRLLTWGGPRASLKSSTSPANWRTA